LPATFLQPNVDPYLVCFPINSSPPPSEDTFPPPPSRLPVPRRLGLKTFPLFRRSRTLFHEHLLDPLPLFEPNFLFLSFLFIGHGSLIASGSFPSSHPIFAAFSSYRALLGPEAFSPPFFFSPPDEIVLFFSPVKWTNSSLPAGSLSPSPILLAVAPLPFFRCRFYPLLFQHA